MRRDAWNARTWILAVVAGWSLLVAVLAMFGLGGRITPLPADPDLVQPLPRLPAAPPEQSRVTGSPAGSLRVASPVPTIAGTFSSRLTMAAWLVGPPLSVTIPAALRISGTQSGSVRSVTSIPPSGKPAASAGVATRQTGPLAIALPTLAPSTSTVPFCLSL